MPNEVVHRFPWEPPAVKTTDETVAALQRDFAYAVQMTAVRVRSNRPELEITVNTQRGQIVPQGQSKFTDGTTIEFQDIGMPQPGLRTMTVEELLRMVTEITIIQMGLELAQ